MATAKPRWRRLENSLTSTVTATRMAPTPTPVTARETSSQKKLGASAEPTSPRPSMAKPRRIRVRRPQRSTCGASPREPTMEPRPAAVSSQPRVEPERPNSAVTAEAAKAMAERSNPSSMLIKSAMPMMSH